MPGKLLNLRALGESERILYIDAQISDCAFNLGMSEQPRVIIRILLCH